MKILSLTFLSLCSTSAFSMQTLNCKFTDASNTDKVIVTLDNTQSGSFFYSTGPSDDASMTTDGKLSLKKIDSGSKDIAAYVTGGDSALMTIKIPTASLSKESPSVGVTLTSEVSSLNLKQDQALNCDSKI